MPETKKAACPLCPRTDVSLVAGGVLRAHAANGKKITPENPMCPGSGGHPKGAYEGEPGGEHHGGGALCKECRMPYPLTANQRIRTHLDRSGRANCPGGSDWPLGVEGISPVLEQEVEAEYGRSRAAAAELNSLYGPEHVHDFEYGDDGKGHSGSFCVCGMEEPDDPSTAARAGATVTVIPRSAADDFLGGGSPTPEPEQGGKGPWFDSAYDGDCSGCYTSFLSGDVIRADGDGGWEAQDCCGDEIESDAEARAAVAERPKHISLQLPVKNGRYEGPHPITGKKTKWTRTTTFAETIADSIALDQWKSRMAALGLARRPDLMENVKRILKGGVAYEVARERRDDLNSIVEQAKLAAGSKDRAKKGTQLHKHTEEVESGRKTVKDVPDEYRPDVAVYLAALEAAGFRPVPHLIERSVLTLELAKGIVGTFDRVLECIRDQPETVLEGRRVQIHAGDYVIGDVKSGAMLDYAWQEIQIQESIYAHGINEHGVATVVYDDQNRPHWAWSPLSEQGIKPVREDVGIVMHMPYGEARCSIVPADLIAGWRDAKLCAAVRSGRDPKMPEPLLSLTKADVTGAAAAIIKELGDMTSDETATIRHAEPEAFDRPTAAQMTTGHPSVTRPPTVAQWEAKFRAVKTPEEGNAAWQEAKDAGLTKEVIKTLLAVVDMEKAQAAVSRPSRPTPAPVANPGRTTAPAPAPVPAQPTYEDRARSVTTRPEASALFQEMKGEVAKIGMTRLNALVKLMQDTLAKASN
jgi:hypothetical protein